MAYEAKANDFRRTWDTDEYEQKARERLGHGSKDDDGAGDEGKRPGGSRDDDKDVEGPKPKSLLKPREERIDLESKLGKTVVISKATPTSQAGGFYCETCDCVVKDSINYLDHINGKKHQRNMGMTMKVKKSTVDDVKSRFEMLKRKKEEQKKDYDVNERMKELREEEEKLKEYRREKRKDKKRKRDQTDEADEDGDDEMARMMGFSKFSTGKGSKK